MQPGVTRSDRIPVPTHARDGSLPTGPIQVNGGGRAGDEPDLKVARACSGRAVEAVPDASDGHEVTGNRRVRLELGPQALDVHVQRLGVPEVVRAPDAAHQLLTGQD